MMQITYSKLKQTNMAQQKARLCIVEDNEHVKEGYELLLSSHERYVVAGSYTTMEAAIKRLGYDKPDVVLVDVDLPGMNGIEGIKRMREKRPSTRFLVITVHENSDTVFEALVAGAIGYITKNSDYHRVVDALDEVLSGGAPMSTHIARMVVQSFRASEQSPLSKRETEVLNHLAQGKTYHAIADDLFVSTETIKSHIKNIYEKLQVNNKADAIVLAMKKKLI